MNFEEENKFEIREVSVEDLRLLSEEDIRELQEFLRELEREYYGIQDQNEDDNDTYSQTSEDQAQHLQSFQELVSMSFTNNRNLNL